MNQLGAFALIVGGLAAIWATLRGVQAWQAHNPKFTRQAQMGIYGAFGAVTFAVLLLLYQLVTSNFVNEYVASYTSRALPLYYKLSALWAGQAGSLLLWLWLITIFAVIFIARHRDDYPELMPVMVAVFGFTALLFFGLTVFVTSPFETLNFLPRDGNGMNPLLQNWGMIIHPPLLYLGYVGWTVPFAFLISALVTKNLKSNWLKQARPWTIMAWLFLALGNLIGAQWAYVELGWGGYWAWDPVENASLMPWLLATAFVHSQIMQERRGLFKFWNASLLLFTFLFSIFGTYLTRSGVLQSVHAFGDSHMGPYFLVFMGIVLFGGIGLIISRRKELSATNEVQSVVSREGTVLMSNIFFTAMTLTVLWGTMYPLTSRWFFGGSRTVDISYFNDLNVPLGIFILFLTGIGPLIAWRKAKKSNFVRHFSVPIAAGVAAVIVLALFGITELYPLLTFGLAAFVLVGIIQEFLKGTLATMARTGKNAFQSLVILLGSARRRYGGYVIHLGVVMIFIGIAGSSAYNVEKEVKLARGESLTLNNYKLTYADFESSQTALKWSGIAVLDVEKNGKYVGQIRPEKAKFFKSEQPMSEVALRMTLSEDLYVVLGGFDENRNIWLTVRINPLINWMWIGGIFLILGTVIALFPETDTTQPQKKKQRALRDLDVETLISELSELEIDYAEGKIDASDYHEEYEAYSDVDPWIKNAAIARAKQNGNGHSPATVDNDSILYCASCGVELPVDARFCSHCGERMQA